MAPAFLLFTFVLFIPICQSIYYSLCSYDALTKPEFIGLENYKQLLFNDKTMRIALKNSMFFMIFSCVSQLIVGLLLAAFLTNMILGVITSISLVIMPKMASEGKETQKVVMKKSLEATVMLGTLFAVIIMANTKQFVPFFFGDKYIPMTPLMFWFTLTIIMIPTGGVFANQFALANQRDKDYAFPVVIGAIVEIVLSYILDRPYGAWGAMIAILITEAVVLVLRLWVVRDGYDFAYVFHDVPKYFLIAIITLAVGMFMPNLIHSAFFNMAVKSIIMLVIYLGLMFLLKLDFNEDIIKLVKNFFKRG